MVTKAPAGISTPPDGAWLRERLDERCASERGSASEGEKRAAVIGADQVPEHDEREGGHGRRPGEIGPLRDSREAARTTHRVDVEDRDPDDLAEAERHDGEVIAPEPHRREPDQEPLTARDEPAL